MIKLWKNFHNQFYNRILILVARFMELLSRWKKNEILFNFFPFDVSQLNECGLYMNNTAYLIFKIFIWASWIIITCWQIVYWNFKILLFLSTWNILLGIFYSSTSLLELIFMKRLKPYKLWRVNHFLFVNITVLSILIVLFDSSLINRSYLDYTDKQNVADLLFYCTSVVPVILNTIQLIFNNVMVSNFKCLLVYVIIGGPYIVLLTLYTLLQPIYQQITFKDQHTFIILLSTCIITGTAYVLVRIYCQVFKLSKAIELLSKIAQNNAIHIQQPITVIELEQNNKPKNLADYTKMQANRKPPPVRGTRGKMMLPSLRKVFTSIIVENNE